MMSCVCLDHPPELQTNQVMCRLDSAPGVADEVDEKNKAAVHEGVLASETQERTIVIRAETTGEASHPPLQHKLVSFHPDGG